MIRTIGDESWSRGKTWPGIRQRSPSCILESSCRVQGCDKKNYHTDKHQQALKQVCPDRCKEATHQRIPHDGHGKNDQANVVTGFRDRHRIFRQREFSAVRPCQLDHNCPCFELREHHERQIQQDEDCAGKAESWTVKACSKKIGNGNRSRSPTELSQSLSENTEPGNRDHHVAADPQRNDPTVGINK